MKAVINSNSLIEISKLIKADEFSVVVKDEDVKIIGTNTYENESYIEQVVIKENSYGNEKNGYKTIPRNVIQLFPKNTTLIIISNQKIKKLNWSMKRKKVTRLNSRVRKML